MPRPRRVVFIIDSDESSRVTHETILRTEGYDIITATDGNAALRLLREQPPDLAIVGSRIGPLPTPQLVRLVKTDVKLAAIPIIVHAAVGAGSEQEATAAGADEFLPTPVTAQELVRAVVNLIGRA